jgi:hypothetical protein
MYEHINHLQEIRKALVEKRRVAARTSVENAAASKERLASTSWAAEIKLIQEQLKAIDEAVAEEKKSADWIAAQADTTVPSEANAFGYDDA